VLASGHGDRRPACAVSIYLFSVPTSELERQVYSRGNYTWPNVIVQSDRSLGRRRIDTSHVTWRRQHDDVSTTCRWMGRGRESPGWLLQAASKL
jgi:hypothetical protein